MFSKSALCRIAMKLCGQVEEKIRTISYSEKYGVEPSLGGNRHSILSMKHENYVRAILPYYRPIAMNTKLSGSFLYLFGPVETDRYDGIRTKKSVEFFSFELAADNILSVVSATRSPIRHLIHHNQMLFIFIFYLFSSVFII